MRQIRFSAKICVRKEIIDSSIQAQCAGEFISQKGRSYGLFDKFTHVTRIVYMVILWAFIAGLLLQFFFAGLSVFVGPTWWDAHTAFGRGFGVTPVLLLLLALAGRLPRRQIVMASILIPLYVLQILLIELPGRFGVIAVSALHPVNAAIMLGLAVVLAHRAWKITRGDKSNH